MNKELEEFKKKMEQKLNSVLDNISKDGVIKSISRLILELKPKPEFIEGEIVQFYGEGAAELGIFGEYGRDKEFPYKTIDGCFWSGCGKLESLPMYMTKYDGTNKPTNSDIVSVKLSADSDYDYTGGRAEDILWEDVIEFQILKDLNP